MIRSPWVIRGGIGGSMWLCSAAGVYPYRWALTVNDPQIRRWVHREHAERIAALVDGVVVEREEP